MSPQSRATLDRATAEGATTHKQTTTGTRPHFRAVSTPFKRAEDLRFVPRTAQGCHPHPWESTRASDGAAYCAFCPRQQEPNVVRQGRTTLRLWPFAQSRSIFLPAG